MVMAIFGWQPRPTLFAFRMTERFSSIRLKMTALVRFVEVKSLA
jgi:hypothetical protein